MSNQEFKKISEKLIELFNADQAFQEKEDLKDEFEAQVEKGASYIKKIFKKYGYVDRKRFGFMTSLAAWTLVQHTGLNHLSFKELYLKKMKEVDDIPFRGCQALLVDKILKLKEKPQIYGSQLEDTQYELKQFYKIKDISKVDELRASMGLPTLKEYSKKFKPVPKLPKSYK